MSPIGVTVRKNIRPIMTGLTILWSRRPNRNHKIFSGRAICGIVNATVRNKTVTPHKKYVQLLMLLPKPRLNPEMIAKKHANTRQKLLSEPTTTLSSWSKFSCNCSLLNAHPSLGLQSCSILFKCKATAFTQIDGLNFLVSLDKNPSANTWHIVYTCFFK